MYVSGPFARVQELAFWFLYILIIITKQVVTGVGVVSFYVVYLFFQFKNTFFSLPRVKTYNSLTVHLHFTESNPNVRIIPIRIRRVSSVVVVDDVSPVVRTGDVDRIKYFVSGVVGVPKTPLFTLGVTVV